MLVVSITKAPPTVYALNKVWSLQRTKAVPAETDPPAENTSRQLLTEQWEGWKLEHQPYLILKGEQSCKEQAFDHFCFIVNRMI